MRTSYLHSGKNKLKSKLKVCFWSRKYTPSLPVIYELILMNNSEKPKEKEEAKQTVFTEQTFGLWRKAKAKQENKLKNQQTKARFVVVK